MRDGRGIGIALSVHGLNPVLEVVLVAHAVSRIGPNEPGFVEGNLDWGEHFCIQIIGPGRKKLNIDGLGVNVF